MAGGPLIHAFWPSYWFSWYGPCPKYELTFRSGMVPMMTSRGTSKIKAGPEGATCSWKQVQIVYKSSYSKGKLRADVQLLICVAWGEGIFG